jgi:hypothetical protein
MKGLYKNISQLHEALLFQAVINLLIVNILYFSDEQEIKFKKQ